MMANARESVAITLEDNEIFEAARNQIAILKKTFDCWVTIGRAVVRARKIAKEIGGAKTFMRLIEQQGLGAVVNKATASRLEIIMQSLPEVTKWHESLTQGQQIAWAAPTTIMKHCPVFRTKPKPNDDDADKPFKPVDLNRAVESVVHHLAENNDADLRQSVIERIAGPQRQDGDLFKPSDTAEDIATVLVGMFSKNKAETIARAILRLLKERAAA